MLCLKTYNLMMFNVMSVGLYGLLLWVGVYCGISFKEA